MPSQGGADSEHGDSRQSPSPSAASSSAPNRKKKTPSDVAYDILRSLGGNELSAIPLVIRFATSIPDQHLGLSTTDASIITVGGLIERIHVLVGLDSQEIKLIYGGRVLRHERTKIWDALDIPRHLIQWQEQQRQREDKDAMKEETNKSILESTVPLTEQHKGKGKQRVENEMSTYLTNAFPPIYIHCSITSAAKPTSVPLSAPNILLPVAEGHSLESAPADASRLPTSLITPTSPTSPTTTGPAPRGFDSLLSTSGLSASDIESLRAQFRAMISARHTPATMPSAARLLQMEESWLDPTTSGAATTGWTSAYTTEGNPRIESATGVYVNDGAAVPIDGEPTTVWDDEDTPSRALDDLLYGVLYGFFWPLGCAAWVLRESGIWSRRRQGAVLVGLGINFAFGAIRALS